MAGTNGHAHSHPPSVIDPSSLHSTNQVEPGEEKFSDLKIKELVAQLEVPFDTTSIEWRVTNTANDGKRGLVVPYANPRAYTDRLNALLTPAGWTRRYTISTTASFERAKDKKVIAKILVTCELTIFGVGTHSATGEEFADSECALTAAEAQAFKRAASCLGLGRYLYYFTGMWVDLDDHKRPKSVPKIFGWATPEGWLSGLRPPQVSQTVPTCGQQGTGITNSEAESMVKEIEALSAPLGRGLYRGILRDIARVWNPRDIQSSSVQRTVLQQMRKAERDVQRLESALEKAGTDRLTPILRSLGISSLERVDTLDKLAKVIVELESFDHES